MKIKDMLYVLSQHSPEMELMITDTQIPLILHEIGHVGLVDYIDIIGNTIPVISINKKEYKS